MGQTLATDLRRSARETETDLFTGKEHVGTIFFCVGTVIYIGRPNKNVGPYLVCQ